MRDSSAAMMLDSKFRRRGGLWLGSRARGGAEHGLSKLRIKVVTLPKPHVNPTYIAERRSIPNAYRLRVPTRT